MSVCGTVYDRFLFLYIRTLYNIVTKYVPRSILVSGYNIIAATKLETVCYKTSTKCVVSVFFLAGYHARTLNWFFFCFLSLLNVLSVNRIPNIVTSALGIFSKRSPLVQSCATVVLNSGKIKKCIIIFGGNVPL